MERTGQLPDPQRSGRDRADAGSDGLSRGGLLWLAGAVILALVAYRKLLTFEVESEIPRELEGWFFQPESSSSALILLLAGWLLYRRWDRLLALPARGAPRAVTALLLLAGLGATGWATHTRAFELLVPALMLTGLGFAALYGGLPAIRAVALPVAFLAFALPMPAPLLNVVIYRFQIWTAEYTGWLLHLFGYPAFVSGDLIYRGAQNFAIIETCAGYRSVETLTMLAVLMADLFRRRPAHAVLIVLAAPPIAFALNGFRALTLILNPHAEIVAIHNLQGVAILLGGLTLLYGLDGLLGRFVFHRARAGAAAAESPGRARAPAPPARPRAAVATAALAAAAALSLWLPRAPAHTAGNLSLALSLDRAADGWRARELAIDRGFLGSVLFRDAIHRRYDRDGDVVRLFAGVGYRSHRLRSSISPKNAMPRSGWLVEEAGERWLAPLDREVGFRVVRSGAHRRLVYHWYEGTRGLADEIRRALFALDASALHRPRNAVAVRLSTELTGLNAEDRGGAEARLERFALWLRDPLETFGLPQGTRE